MIRKVSPVTEQRGLLITFKSLREKTLISCFHNDLKYRKDIQPDSSYDCKKRLQLLSLDHSGQSFGAFF
jgi:hypothetical protein